MKCVACGKGNLNKTSRKQTYTYKDKSIELDQPGMWCDQCDEGILSGADIEKTEKAFEEFKDKIDKVLSPEDIRYIRKNVLGLSQKEAGKIFGGGPNAFGRYERGEAKPMLAIINLLKMFERHPNDIKHFRDE